MLQYSALIIHGYTVAPQLGGFGGVSPPSFVRLGGGVQDPQNSGRKKLMGHFGAKRRKKKSGYFNDFGGGQPPKFCGFGGAETPNFLTICITL